MGAAKRVGQREIRGPQKWQVRYGPARRRRGAGGAAPAARRAPAHRRAGGSRRRGPPGCRGEGEGGPGAVRQVARELPGAAGRAEWGPGSMGGAMALTGSSRPSHPRRRKTWPAGRGLAGGVRGCQTPIAGCWGQCGRRRPPARTSEVSKAGRKRSVECRLSSRARKRSSEPCCGTSRSSAAGVAHRGGLSGGPCSSALGPRCARAPLAPLTEGVQVGGEGIRELPGQALHGSLGLSFARHFRTPRTLE